MIVVFASSIYYYFASTNRSQREMVDQTSPSAQQIIDEKGGENETLPQNVPTTSLTQQIPEENNKESETLSQNIQWKQFVNTEQGYKIDYPADWVDGWSGTFLPTIPGSSVVASQLFRNSDNTESDYRAPGSFEILVYTLNSDIPLEEIAPQAVDRVAATSYSPASTVSSPQWLTIDNIKGVRYTVDSTYTASDGGFMMEIILKQSRTIFELEALSPTKEIFFEYQDVFEHMIKSFELI